MRYRDSAFEQFDLSFFFSYTISYIISRLKNSLVGQNQFFSFTYVDLFIQKYEIYFSTDIKSLSQSTVTSPCIDLFIFLFPREFLTFFICTILYMWFSASELFSPFDLYANPL